MDNKSKVSRDRAITAHRITCPSWVPPEDKDEKDVLSFNKRAKGRCGSNYAECNTECWYMRTFISALDH